MRQFRVRTIGSAIFLPWWDVGSSEELLNLNNAPAVVADLWGFHFLNPPSWVTSPMPREPSTWQAYCARDAERATASSAPAAEEERNETEEVQAEGRQRQTHETIQDVMMRLRSKDALAIYHHEASINEF